MTFRSLLSATMLVACFAAITPCAAQNLRTQRIVTLGGAITETVFALGAGAHVVGVDKSSTFPASVNRLPNVGYFRQAGAEGILALSPTLVIADTGSSPSTIAQLRSAGTRVVLMPVGESADIAVTRIRRIGVLLGVPAQADSLALFVTRGVARAESEARARPTHPRALFVYARGVGTLFVAGMHTGAAEMLRLVGAVNVGSTFEGYKPFTAEAVATSGADVIVVPERGLASLGGIDALLALPGIAQTPAARARRVVTVDDGLLLGFGPRLPEAIQTLSRVIGESIAARPAASARR